MDIEKILLQMSETLSEYIELDMQVSESNKRINEKRNESTCLEMKAQDISIHSETIAEFEMKTIDGQNEWSVLNEQLHEMMASRKPLGLFSGKRGREEAAQLEGMIARQSVIVTEKKRLLERVESSKVQSIKLFQERYQAAPEQAPSLIQQLCKEASALAKEVEALEKAAAPTRAKRDSVGLTYKKLKILVETTTGTQDDGPRTQIRLPDYPDNRKPNETVEEFLKRKDILRKLDWITPEDLERINRRNLAREEIIRINQWLARQEREKQKRKEMAKLMERIRTR